MERKCYHCDKVCQNWDKLRSHYLAHKGERNLECSEPDCNFKTYSKQSLVGHKNMHKRKRGEASKVFFCEQCGTEFCDKNTLEGHIRFMHEHKTDNITCDQCGKYFRRRANYKKHYNKEHSTDPKFNCSQCGKRFKTVEHVKKCENKHNGIYPYNCHICGKGMVNKMKMEDHIRVHTGERPFSCKHCEYKAKSQSALFIHVRALHRKEKEEEAAERERLQEESRLLTQKALENE